MQPEHVLLLAALLSAKVECVVVGGMAVIAHGYERTTRDLDIFIRPTEENAGTAFATLAKLNIPLEAGLPVTCSATPSIFALSRAITTSTS